MFVEALSAFLADFGVPVTFTGAPVGALGILDFDDQEILGATNRGAVLGRHRTLLIETTFAALLSEDTPLTAGAESFAVLEVRAVDDGAFSLVTLR